MPSKKSQPSSTDLDYQPQREGETEGQEAQRLQAEFTTNAALRRDSNTTATIIHWRGRAIRAEAEARWVPLAMDALKEIKELLIKAKDATDADDRYKAREGIKAAGKRVMEAMRLLADWKAESQKEAAKHLQTKGE